MQALINTRLKYLILGIFVLSLFGCNRYEPVAHLPNTDALVGDWELSEESKKFMQQNDICCIDTPPKLILMKDHKFALTNIQDCWYRFDGSCDLVGNLKGDWRLYKDELDARSNATLVLDSESTRHFTLFYIDGSYAIIFWFGDPDSDNFIILKKKSN